MSKNYEIISVDDPKEQTRSLSNFFGLVSKPTAKELSAETELSKLTKTIIINKEKCRVNPVEIIRHIKTITQTIGQYKSDESPLSMILVRGLRQSRSEFVQILEQEFQIHWKLDLNQNSIFFR